MRALHRPAGFTLLEMSVVLVIIGVVLAGGMSMFTASLQKRQQQETRAKLDAIQQALYLYRLSANRLPCPADITLALGHANFGVEAANKGACTGGTPAANDASGNKVMGMVPTTTLQLPDDYATDGWGRRILYAVDKHFTASGGFVSHDIHTDGALTVGSDASAAPPAINDPGFENPSVGIGSGSWSPCNGFQTNPASPYWSFGGSNAGLAGNGSCFSFGNPNAPDGTQVAFIQMTGSVSQTLTFAGTCTISFFGAQRGNWNAAPNGININVDGVIIDSITPGGTSYQQYTTTSFTVANGTHTIAFSGTDPGGTDDTAFIDSVSINCAGAAGNTDVYALVSFGPNGHGAYPCQGGAARLSSGSVNADELKNCHCDSAGASTGFDGTFVQHAVTQDPATPDHTDDFDDIVAYSTRFNLASPKE
jgi:prepilin-type N-terminal cleavage/methylation domain-containing protein